MPIESKHKGGGDRISEPGEYVVTVTKVEATKSKKGQPMCVVEFSTYDGRVIAGYYVGALKFHMAALKDCKLGAGLKETDPATNLVGRELGIKVEPGKARDDGSHFMSITGYGTKSDVTGFEDLGSPFNDDMSNVPF